MTRNKISQASADASSNTAATPAPTPAQRRFAAVLGNLLAERWSAAAETFHAGSSSTTTGPQAAPPSKS